MTAPNLTLAIGEAQVQVDTLGGDRPLQADDFEFSRQNPWLVTAGTGKSDPAEVPNNAQHKAFRLLLLG